MLKLLEEIENRIIRETEEKYPSTVIGVASTYMIKGGKTPLEAATQAQKTFKTGIMACDINIRELEQILYDKMLKYLINLNMGEFSGPGMVQFFPITLHYFNQPTKQAKAFAEYVITRLGQSAFDMDAAEIAATYSKTHSWRKNDKVFPLKNQMKDGKIIR
jgi:hypothetical protein